MVQSAKEQSNYVSVTHSLTCRSFKAKWKNSVRL